MPRFVAFLASIAIAFVAEPLSATALWQNAETGMSPAEVKALFPGANSPAKVDTLASGARCELAIDNFSVAKRPYRVCFFFRNGGLAQVTLGAVDPSVVQFEGVIELLRSKYGPELEQGQQHCKSGLMTTCEANWALATGANISVVYLRIGRSAGTLNINYQTRLASEAEKL